MNTLTLSVEELEQRIAPGVAGMGGDGPPDNRVRPPFFVLTPPAES